MAHDPTAGRGYGSSASTRASSRTLDDLVPASISTDARSPLVIITDGTGSMGEFPEKIFAKLPLLDLGIEDYLEDASIAFGMIGDAGSDTYALQMQGFGRGKDLEKALKNIVIQGGGGGNKRESYDLAALYCARNVEMPNAKKPVLIFIGDEGLYDRINPTWASMHARVDLKEALSTKDVFDDLKNRFSVYCIRKHYESTGGDRMSPTDVAMQKQWESYLGPGRIAVLNDPQRVVDVIFGLLAVETGKVDFFTEELTDRQTPAQVATVMKSISMMDSTKGLPKGNSKLLRSGNTKKTSTALGK
jgi:hypothetical protein